MSLVARLAPLASLARGGPRPLSAALRPLTTLTETPRAEPEPSPAAASSPRPHHAVISIAGEDRVGIVRTVTSAVASHRANVEESKMAILGGDFAMIVYISMESQPTAEDLVSQLRAELPAFSVSMRATTAPREGSEGGKAMWALSLEGPDQPGIVANVTQALATHGANVHEMDTETTTAPFAGYSLFKMNGKVAVNDADLNSVTEALNKVEEKYGMTIILDQIPAKE